MRQFHVRNALAEALHERFVLAGGKRLFPAGFSEFKQTGAHLRFACADRSEGAPVSICHLQETLEEFRRLGSTPDSQKIDDLDEQPRLAAARAPHGVNEPPEPLDITVVADAQQRPARDVANAGRLHDDRAWPTAREPLVPGDDGIGGKAVIRRAPGHHRGNPGALRERQPTFLERREQARALGFLTRGNRAGLGGVANAFRRTPHNQTSPGEPQSPGFRPWRDLRSGRRPERRSSRENSFP